MQKKDKKKYILLILSLISIGHKLSQDVTVQAFDMLSLPDEKIFNIMNA